MSICFFGSYDPGYARNKILIDGLQKNGVKVFHCRCLAGSIWSRFPQLLRQFLRINHQVDVIYVAFVGQLNIPLAWVLGKLFGKKVILDMFYSMYDTYVFDRQSAHEGSWRARSYWWIDKLAATFSDIVVTDTQAHADYFTNLFHIPATKFKRVFVGGDETIFKPRSQKIIHRRTKVIFHGMFTRLHGAEYFVKAAKRLENERNLELILVGSSQNYLLPIKLYEQLKPRNLTYYPEMSIRKLAKLLRQCDISVGHIGTTDKAKNVITNKMFQALASRVVVIAGDCKASQEVFYHGVNAWFTKMGDSQDLAQSIRYLSKQKKLRLKLAANGYQLFLDKLSNTQIGNRLLSLWKD